MTLVLTMLVAGVLMGGCARPTPVSQPIQFNHKAHADAGVACGGCHESAETAAPAGMPSTETCMTCHEEAITDSPEEEKIGRYAEKEEAIPWVRVYEAPGHVYFSHRRHVTLGHVDCVACHGEVGERVAPVTVAAVPIRMNRCMSCHARADTTNDCNACHR